MKNRKNIKSFIFIGIGLIGIIITLIVNNHIENDLICLFLMGLFLIVELYGFKNIMKVNNRF